MSCHEARSSSLFSSFPAFFNHFLSRLHELLTHLCNKLLNLAFKRYFCVILLDLTRFSS